MAEKAGTGGGAELDLEGRRVPREGERTQAKAQRQKWSFEGKRYYLQRDRVLCPDLDRSILTPIPVSPSRKGKIFSRP